MPNWCFTNLTINHHKKKELKKFYENLQKWTSTNYKENDYGLKWLGNIVGNSGIGTINTRKDIALNCDGAIVTMDFSDEIILSLETPWRPHLMMWKKLVDRDLPGAEIIFIAQEQGHRLFVTNECAYIGKYCVISWNDAVEANDIAKEVEVIEMLQDLFNTKERQIAKLLEQLDNSKEFIDIAVAKWKYDVLENWL